MLRLKLIHVNQISPAYSCGYCLGLLIFFYFIYFCDLVLSVTLGIAIKFNFSDHHKLKKICNVYPTG